MEPVVVSGSVKQDSPMQRPDETTASINCYARDAQNSCSDAKLFATTYQTARALIQKFGMTTEDVSKLSERFWEFYLDGACVADVSACTVASIHSNLCMGTIAPHATLQPQLHAILQQLETFDLCGEFMLTEIGHGLDARSIETTATLSADGTTFELHTPSLAAAKSMPPTTPLGKVPKIAVVFAQLMIDGELQGVRAFVVRITDGNRMCPGVTAKLLPRRPGTRPLDHAITTFSHVTVDRGCLLGTIEKPTNVRESFFQQIYRVSVGGLALSLINIPALKACAYLVYTFSRGRMVTNPASQLPVPILSFPTQYGPIVSTVAHAVVIEAAGRSTIDAFRDVSLPHALRQALVCIFKATITYSTQRQLNELTDRCGWRGLFGFNKISELQLALKGNSIAEGDALVLCIRLASELLQGKYQLPQSSDPTSLLAQHERALFDELRRFITCDDEGNTNHRSDTFAKHVTPRARDLIEAIGHRIAYDSARTSDLVRRELLDVWGSECLLQDAAWYVEQTDLTYREIHHRHIVAVESVMPHLGSIIDGFEMEKHFGSTPLVSGKHWNGFIDELPGFGGDGVRSKL